MFFSFLPPDIHSGLYFLGYLGPKGSRILSEKNYLVKKIRKKPSEKARQGRIELVCTFSGSVYLSKTAWTFGH